MLEKNKVEKMCAEEGGGMGLIIDTKFRGKLTA